MSLQWYESVLHPAWPAVRVNELNRDIAELERIRARTRRPEARDALWHALWVLQEKRTEARQWLSDYVAPWFEAQS